MPISKKQMDSVQKYRSSHYYRIPVNILLENRDVVRRAAEERGVSLNVYINSLIQKDLAERGVEYRYPGEDTPES